ncbi:MAG: mechanosensitive ion channel family protein, partial [Halobacteriovoraceae bacterium]|nr:mechanosensitive ion channel family protein [Halobacteriovoraceae bacterium]
MNKTLLIISLLFQFSLWAQSSNYPSATLKNPRETFRYFLKTMKGYKLGDKDALPMAVKALDLSEFDPQTKRISGETAAIKLVNTIDRLEYVDFQKIPTDVEAKRWVYHKEIITTQTGEVDVVISLSQGEDKKWRFSTDTVTNIAQFERALKSRKIATGVKELTSWKEDIKNKMPDWTANRGFVLLNGQWLALGLLIFLGFLSERILRFILLSLVVKALGKKGIIVNEELQKKLSFPLGVVVFTLFWNLGVRLLEFEDGLLSWLLRGGQVVFTIGCVLAAYQLVDYFCLYLEKKALESENKFDDILVPLIRKSSKTFVVAIGLIAIGDSLALDMKGLLAGMGIAGLGVSLAAKDTLSNLFGSLTVLLDRPFIIGDWVNINGNIEGTVEEVGLRSCRIRTFHNSLITIPNGILTNASIDNLGMRRYRRLSTTIGVQYDTPPEKIEAFCEGIRQIILSHPYTRKESFHVYFNSMG